MLYWKLVGEYKDKIKQIQGGMWKRDVLSDNASYTLKSTKNNYWQRYVVRYFSSFCRTE